ncbi:flagellin [Candidatus Blastococcus massiliensis]|uniref:flagellin N-terminal helical domain-containing protein n=1 Tax=Candidatus Blastococcus massiliensis TaxID=1470358 RepID=UPI0004B01F5C|nr:flagellin [Candidatus Blastococcus massiliensis]
MGLRVNNNIAALNAYRNLSVTDGQMSKSLEKLSSGFRINRAADDAAGLAISEGLRSQIGGLKVAVRNTQDGISVVQTAEGALTETTSILQRMRDLSVQAANDGGLNTDAKGNIQKEIDQLNQELDRIATTTKFNGKALLDGNYSAKFQVGANAGESIDVAIGTPGAGMNAAGLGVNNVDVTSGGPSWTFDPGAVDYAAATGPVITVDVEGSGARTLDVTGWATTGTSADAAKNQALLQKAFDKELGTSGYTVKVGDYGQVTASGPTGAVDGDLVIGGAGITGTHAFGNLASGADAAIAAIDGAIKTVSTTRADLGAIQNRFDHTINNLNVAVENLTASESRIRDADMAQEMVQFTRNQILTQAGTAMLAQANQASQGVLSLLR